MNQQNMGTQSNLLRCPRCFLDGKTNVIAELLPNGDIGIERQRAKWGYENMTIVHGSNFELICGYCREKVFVRKEEIYEGSNIGSIRVHWLAFGPDSVSQGLGSNQNQSGTALFA